MPVAWGSLTPPSLRSITNRGGPRTALGDATARSNATVRFNGLNTRITSKLIFVTGSLALLFSRHGPTTTSLVRRRLVASLPSNWPISTWRDREGGCRKLSRMSSRRQMISLVVIASRMRSIRSIRRSMLSGFSHSRPSRMRRTCTERSQDESTSILPALTS